MATSRDDFVIAIRSAFLKRANKQRFSLIGLIFFSIGLIIFSKINLPFTNVNDGKSYQVTTGYVNGSAGYGTTLTFILFPNETRLRAYNQTTTGVAQLTGSNLGNSFSFLGRVFYFVE